MVPPRPAVCALLMAFLGSAQGWARARSCSVHEVLHHYQAVIFQDLKAAIQWVEPGAHNAGAGERQGWSGAACRGQKERSILRSIESLGQTLRRITAGIRRGSLEKAAWTVAVRTEAAIRSHCWAPRQPSRRPSARPVEWQGGRRRLLLGALHAVATCWEKLFALRAQASGGS